MKKLFLLLLIVPVLVLAQPKQKPGVTYDAVITRVIDGDTVAFQADFLPAPLKKELMMAKQKMIELINKSADNEVVKEVIFL